MRATAYAVARPTMPPPTTTTSIARGAHGRAPRSRARAGRVGAQHRRGRREVAHAASEAGSTRVRRGDHGGRLQPGRAAGHGRGHRRLQRGELQRRQRRRWPRRRCGRRCRGPPPPRPRRSGPAPTGPASRSWRPPGRGRGSAEAGIALLPTVGAVGAGVVRHGRRRRGRSLGRRRCGRRRTPGAGPPGRAAPPARW